jgi:hypothetical protein
LGIVGHTAQLQQVQPDNVPATLNSNRQQRSLIGNVQITTEPLKYDDNFHKTFQEKQNRAMNLSTSTDSLFSAFSSIFIGAGQQQQQQEEQPKEE